MLFDLLAAEVRVFDREGERVGDGVRVGDGDLVRETEGVVEGEVRDGEGVLENEGVGSELLGHT